MRFYKFEDIPVWQESIKLVKAIYDLSSKPNIRKDYGLSDQLKRSAVSISSNIVEGYEKSSNNEFIRFLKIAKGSSGELRNQIRIAHIVGYIDDQELNQTMEMAYKLSQSLGGLIKYLEERRRKKEFQKK